MEQSEILPCEYEWGHEVEVEGDYCEHLVRKERVSTVPLDTGLFLPGNGVSLQCGEEPR